MNDTYSYDTDEMEIDLIDLLKTLLGHYKSILLITLACTLIAAGISAVKSKKADIAGAAQEVGQISQEAQETTQEEEQAKLEEDIKADYELAKLQYEDDLRIYEMRDSIMEEYNASVQMLSDELANLKTIDSLDKDARLASLMTISSLQNVVNNARSMVSYYKDLKRPEEVDDFETYRAQRLEEATETEEEETKTELQVGGISVKYMAIGFVLGMFLGCCVWGMVYLFDGKIKTGSEVARCYGGVNMLGAPDKAGFVAANVRNYIPSGTKSVLVTGSLPQETLNKVADAIKASTGIEDIRAASGLSFDAATAGMLCEVDAVVLVEKLKQTKQSDLLDEIAMVKNSGKKLIGVAV